MQPCMDCHQPTPTTRCPDCTRRHDRERRPKTAARGYGAAWQAHSRAERERQGRCAVCGTTEDLTLDHRTGLVGCRRCHRPDSVGGLLR